MRFSYAIFDMDGVLFDTETLFIRSFVDYVSQKIGYPFTREKMMQLIGINHQLTLETFPKVFPDCPADCETCYALCNVWMKQYFKTNGVPLKPGVRELLAWLKAQGILCAVATSSDSSVAAGYLQSTGIRPYFSAVIGGDQVTHSKPDPEIFLTAMRALGGENPAQCVVFEDSRNGLLAGSNGKFSVIAVPDVMVNGFVSVRDFIIYNLGSFFIVFVAALLVYNIWLAGSKYGAIRLGKVKPQYSTFGWIAMIFCAAMGTSILFWSAIEWAYYVTWLRPFGYSMEDTANLSVAYSFFHWGIPAWSVYSAGVVPIAYRYFVRKKRFVSV